MALLWRSALPTSLSLLENIPDPDGQTTLISFRQLLNVTKYHSNLGCPLRNLKITDLAVQPHVSQRECPSEHALDTACPLHP
jgi:hypothetical protein